MGNKPGVMIYFEIVPVLQMLTLEEQGALFGYQIRDMDPEVAIECYPLP